jgi:hypothetical protein
MVYILLYTYKKKGEYLMQYKQLFNVLILVMISISTAQAQNIINNQFEPRPRSADEQQALKSHVLSMKNDYLQLLESAIETFDQIIEPAPIELQRAAKFWYFGRGLLSIYSKERYNYKVNGTFLEKQKSFFDTYLQAVEANTGSQQEIRFLRSNLQNMEIRFEFTMAHLKAIVEKGLVIVPSKVLSSSYIFEDCPGYYKIDFQFNLVHMDTVSNPNSLSSEFLNRANSWMLDEGFVLNQKTYEFFQKNPTIICKESAWYNVLPRSQSIDYDSKSNSLILIGDSDGLPSMSDVHIRLSELLK